MDASRLARRLPAALVVLCSGTDAVAGPVALTPDDVTLVMYASSDGKSYAALDSSRLGGFFGVHRCLCPLTLSAALELTASGQANLGNSVIGVTLLLGQSCQTAPTACASLGTVTFSASQSAPAPTFSSNLIFQTVQGTTSVDCSSLTAGTAMVLATLTQDGLPLPFALSAELPVVTGTVGAPTEVAVEPASQGLLVSWSPPSDATLVAGYQVLCLPPPTGTYAAGYESCGLPGVTAAGISPADPTQVCSDVLSASATSVRLSGLVDGTTYTVAVVAIDTSGGISALSPLATGAPQPTDGFWERYKQAGGAASGCSVAPGSRSAGGTSLLVLLVVLPLGLVCRSRSRLIMGVVVAMAVAFAAPASGQPELREDDWARADPAPPPPRLAIYPPDWAIEIGVSWYRPDIDDEFTSGTRPFADTFSGSRHPMWVVELDRYLAHRFGTWGVGLRTGYYKVTASAFLSGSETRSGDETSLRMIPLSPSLIYRASGLKARVPLIPYVKLGLDAMYWTVATTGEAGSQSGISLGWHGVVGVMLSLAWLAREANPEGLAEPCALFFEWNHARINGLGMTNSLHVGDSIWFAGLMFDL